jgi:hypothetical protein
MKRSVSVLALVSLAAALTASAATPVTEDFEKGYTDGEPLRVHADWFFEDANDDPTCEDDAGLGGSWGVAKGDRAFTWVAKSFDWNDSKLVSVTVGGDWQTDAEGRLDDDRAGWSISKEDDSSDNVCGVQMDPGGEGESGLNVECYWDGETFGDDAGRKSIVDLPKLKAETWYRLRAKLTKLSETSAKIDVTFVELDGAGNPTGPVTSGSIADTSALSGAENEAVPNKGYFTATTIWPAFKNYKDLEGGFDNAHFEIEEKAEASSAEADVEEAEPETEKESAEESPPDDAATGEAP